MTKGELQYAIRKAFEAFDNWNDVTGVINKQCSYYWEMLGVIEDAVKIGAKVAMLGTRADLSEELEKE